MTNQQRRLYRSQTNRMIAGICGGLSEYLNVDPTLIRLVWILLTLLGGSGIILYIIAYFIIPIKPLIAGESSPPVQSDFTAARIFGILFVAVGMFILLDNLDIFSFHKWWNLSWDFIFPGLLILCGIYFLSKQGKISKPLAPQAPMSEAEQSSPESSPSSMPPTEEMPKSKMLHRSLTDRKILGICAGFGEYFDIDPAIIRIAYVVFTVLSGGMGIVLYFLMYLVIPEGQPQSKKQQ